MSTNVVLNGVTYAIPAEGDSGWGTVLSNYFISIGSNVLQKTAGTFTLTAEANFGATYGLKSAYLKSQATNPSSTGIVRLGNTEAVSWRNAANSADLALVVSAGNILQFNGASLLVAGAASIVNADVSASAAIAYSKLNLASSIVNADINASAAIAYSKLNLATSIVNADIAALAAIAYSKLNLSDSIVNADVNASAAIALSKLAATTVSRALVSDGSGVISPATTTAVEVEYLNGVTSAIQTQIDSKTSNPMTTGGDVIYGGASGVPTRLANGSNGQVLTSSGGTAAPTWTTTGVGDVTLTGTQTLTNKTLTAPKISSVEGYPLAGLRNRIINGDMRIDQRNNGASQTFTAGAALAYCVDRFYGYCTGANVTGQRVAGTTTNQFDYQFTGAGSVTTIGIGQRIEATNCLDLNNGNMKFSVNISNSLLTSVTWTVYRATTTADTFGSLASPTVTQIDTGTFTVTSSKARYSATVALPSAAITGLQIVLTVGAQTSGTWKVGDWQVEAGSVATPFEIRPIGLEHSLCLRYLPAYRSTSSNSTTRWIGFGATTTAATGAFHFPFPTRAAITSITISSAAHFTLSRPSTGNVVATGVSFAAAGTDAAQVEVTTASGLVADIGYFLFFNNAAGYILFNGAEL